MKLLFRYLEHLDSLRLGHAKRLMSWLGLYVLDLFPEQSILFLQTN